jgi:hypothetical protein
MRVGEEKESRGGGEVADLCALALTAAAGDQLFTEMRGVSSASSVSILPPSS